jgi:hypothetical protein
MSGYISIRRCQRASSSGTGPKRASVCVERGGFAGRQVVPHLRGAFERRLAFGGALLANQQAALRSKRQCKFRVDLEGLLVIPERCLRIALRSLVFAERVGLQGIEVGGADLGQRCGVAFDARDRFASFSRNSPVTLSMDPARSPRPTPSPTRHRPSSAYADR